MELMMCCPLEMDATHVSSKADRQFIFDTGQGCANGGLNAMASSTMLDQLVSDPPMIFACCSLEMDATLKQIQKIW